MVAVNPQARGLYPISVAAELVCTGQQRLRLYERRGLLEPGRTDGGTRRYSEDDLVTLGRIAELLDRGLNHSGIRLVLALETENQALRAKLPDQTADPAAAPGQTGTKTGTTARQ
ncbi:hypothetical protein B5P43_12755 [Bacillus sp. SRB_336]|nr:hypothetical protein B5P43_12755 [Bacillus sp. SRB_336]